MRCELCDRVMVRWKRKRRIYLTNGDTVVLMNEAPLVVWSCPVCDVLTLGEDT